MTSMSTLTALPLSIIVIKGAYSFGASNDDAPDFAFFELTPTLWEKIGRLRTVAANPEIAEVTTHFQPIWDRPLPTSLPRLVLSSTTFQCVALDQEIAAHYETEDTHWTTLESEITQAFALGRSYVLLTEEERLQRIECIKVEYHPEQVGGAFTGVGRMIAIPKALIDAEPGEGDAPLQAVFARLTGLGPACIMHIEQDERFTLTLEPFDEDWLE